MQKEYNLLKSSMNSLKRVRDSCGKFEDKLELALSDESEGGCQITENEMNNLYIALSDISRESDFCKIIMRDTLFGYRLDSRKATNG